MGVNVFLVLIFLIGLCIGNHTVSNSNWNLFAQVCTNMQTKINFKLTEKNCMITY